MSINAQKSKGRRDWLMAIGLLALFGACGGEGCGCGMEPLPGGSLPADQTLEGGGQMRITPTGLTKVEQVLDDVVTDSVDGMCIPQGSQGVGVGTVQWCYTNDGSCTPGCQVDVTIDYVDLSTTTAGLRIRTQFDVDTDIASRINWASWLGGGSDSCSFDVTANNTVVDAIVSVGIDPADGELVVTLEEIPDLNLDPTVNGCGVIGDVLDFAGGLVADIIEVDFLRDLLTPLLDGLVQGMLPDPMGIEGVVNVAALFGGVAPGTRAALETRLVPGGYAFVEGGGLSLGFITGMNADEDPNTRETNLDSEPALCVPPFAAPDFAAAPASLTQSPRGNFNLLPAGMFRGTPEPASDVAIGLSETFLDLAGHHAVSSGALCLGLGTEMVPQLNLGAVGVVVPSLAELGEGDEPLLLVTRPQRPLDFTIGDGTTESPSLTLHLQDFEIDFYAFLFERYVRGFSVSMDLDVGINLEFTTDGEGNPALMPILVGLESDNIALSVLNEEFLREDKATLEAVLPSILDLALPLIAGGLPPFALPELLGFQLDDLTLSKVVTDEDDFLAIQATLATSQAMMALAKQYPSLAQTAAELSRPAPVLARAARRPSIVEVRTPAPADIRAALRGEGGAMPRVTLDLPTEDTLGRPLEWTWNLSGGIWREFVPGGEVALEDGAFAIQGRYDIQLRSRVIGDYRTLDSEAYVLPLIIDSAPPRILTERAQVSGQTLAVPAIDLVSPPEAIEYAYGAAGAEQPTTNWAGKGLPLDMAGLMATDTGMVQVFARDELGNTSSALVNVDGIVEFHGNSGGGCGDCSASGRGSALSGAFVALCAILGLGLIRRRRRRFNWLALARVVRAGSFVLVAGLMAQPGCSCSDSGPMCAISEDCAASCADGQVPLCLEGECLCENELRYGRIGQYSEMDISSDGTIWVSGYNSWYGDLMVASRREPGPIPDDAWQFIDGVPDGPVVLPGSSVRGGINDPGPDVGLYTDIAVQDDGTVLVSYFDKDTGSLKLATGSDGTWTQHVIEEGDPTLVDGGFNIVGQYSSLSLRPDGRPGVAYFAHIDDGASHRTELRFAEASSASPSRASDWTITMVDTSEVPAESTDPLTIPMGTGLFVNSARLSDGNPILVYYDRVAGDLMMASALGGTFAEPVVLDGNDVDVGWYPGIAIDTNDNLHVSYVSASNDDLLYINTIDNVPELVDDGYRLVGQTEDGLPKPEYHFVGDDSTVVLTSDGTYIAYQDATTHELLIAHKNSEGVWQHEALAGTDDPFAGAYGFYVSSKVDGGDVVLTTWVVDQPSDDAWVEILRETIAVE